jgi:hypothetical protein
MPRVSLDAKGVLFRVVLGAESVATTLDRKAIEAAMGESWLARFLKFQAVAQLQLLCADRQGEARGVSRGRRRRFE